MAKSNLTKAKEISPETKVKVLERQNYRSISGVALTPYKAEFHHVIYDDDVVELNHEDLYGLKDKLFECMKSWPDYLTDLCKGKFPKLYFFIHAY